MRMRRFLLGLFVVSCTPSGFQVEEDAAVEAHEAGVDAGPDADAGPTACYVDRDGDGVGAGAPVPCDLVLDSGVGGDAGAGDGGAGDGDAGYGDGGADGGADPGGVDSPTVVPMVVELGGDCDDADPRRAPGLEELCDGLDNDCDEDVDGAINNACGGPCLAPLEHEPGAPCVNGLLGACERPGKYVCATAQSVECDAPAPQPSSELCDDGVDNDCDGLTDEPDATNAPSWYQDCDGDGYAASTAGTIRSCTKPANIASGTWTTSVPQPSTKTNWDCDDSRPEYSPAADYGFPPVGATSADLNCDGNALAQPAPVPGLTVCSGNIVASLNQGQAGEEDCSVTDATLDGCIVWRRANGTYAASPELVCPDSGAQSVDIQLQQSGPDDPGNYVCHTFSPPRSPIWPCR
jgi:hypothetical protein